MTEGLRRGLSHQEAPQADGEEEAPQTAAPYASPAPQQEVARMAGRVFLVTGASRLLGGRLAAALANEPGVDRVVAVDAVAPATAVSGPKVTFVRADIRNPVIGSVLAEHEVDTVVHMGVIATPKQAGSRAAMKEINVIGSMQLFAACQRTERVTSVVTKSTAAVYGCGPKDPTAFVEDMSPKHAPRSGWPKDSADVETYLRGLARRRPDITVSTVRFANVIGPTIRTPMTSYFSLPIIPTVMGYDARLQFIHEDDCLSIMRQLAIEPRPGIVNAAGHGIMMLSQAVRRVGRPQLPILEPMFASVTRAIGRSRATDVTREQVRFLTFGRVLDTTRLESDYGIHPEFTTLEAFESFAQAKLSGSYDSGDYGAGKYSPGHSGRGGHDG